MKIISRIVWAILFIVFFGFALQNTQEASLKLFSGQEIKGALVLFLLAFFVAGAVFGVLAMIPSVFRHRRDVSKCRKTIETLQKEQEAQMQARMQPPQPDSVVNK